MRGTVDRVAARGVGLVAGALSRRRHRRGTREDGAGVGAPMTPDPFIVLPVAFLLTAGGLALWWALDEAQYWRGKAGEWEKLAKQFQRVADARMRELEDIHNEMDAAAAEDLEVAELEAQFELPCREFPPMEGTA